MVRASNRVSGPARLSLSPEEGYAQHWNVALGNLFLCFMSPVRMIFPDLNYVHPVCSLGICARARATSASSSPIDFPLGARMAKHAWEG